MNPAIRSRLLLALLSGTLLASACGKNEIGTAGVGEACIRNADCASPFVCLNGKCTLAEAMECTATDRRCDGDTLQECDPVSGQYVDRETCATGCASGACRAASCAQDAMRCADGLVERCNPTGTAWAFFRYCPYGCADATSGNCKPPACPAYDARCAGPASTTREVCDPDTGYVATDCAAGDATRTCLDGQCVDRACTTGQSRCVGDVVERCSPSGASYVAEELCEFGCVASGGTASCAPPACAAGQEACDGGALIRCTPDRREYGFVQFCPAGCQVSGTTASCITCSCAALSRRCSLDPSTGSPIVEQCRADCSRFEPVEQCGQACSGGTCLLSEANCAPGERRCNGREVELCGRLANGGTEWRFEERCLGTCLGTACDGTGACGCTGNVGTGERCGTTPRPALRLLAMLPALGDGTTSVTPTADAGRSTFLFHTDPIVGNDGTPVPDGTLVTFAHDGADSLFVSLDADSTRAGLQRPTVNGRARVVLKSPAGAREVNVTASVGGRCADSRALRFIAAAPGPRTTYIADDFSTTRLFDRSQTVAQLAQWDTVASRVTARGIYDFGTGIDGDYVVPVGGTRDLSTDGLARAFRVSSLGLQEAVIDTVTPGLAPGDEVLLVNVLGTSSSLTGLYETKRIARIEFGRVVFTEPVRNTYGAGSNGDLGTNRVFIQRIPQFNNLTVESTGTLQAASLAASGTGILFVRARGTIRIVGNVSMTESGFPVGSTLNVTSPTNTMSRLFLGNGGTTKAGGGVVVLSGKVVTLRAEGGATALGAIRADSSGAGAGGGGSIWLLGGTLALGQNRVTAQGTNSTFDGRVRLDYGTLLDTPTTVPNPSDAGQKGAFSVISLPAYIEDPSSGLLLRAPRLYGVVGGSQSIVAGLPAVMPGVNVDVTADPSLVWKNLNTGGGPADSFATAGRSFRFRLRLETPTDDPVSVYGVAFSVTVGN